MKAKPITSIDTALYIYYAYPEIGNKEIKKLFGLKDNSTVTRYKKAVQEVQAERNVKTSQMYTVNTDVAYEVWGIDVKSLEHRRKRLKDLGLSV